MVRILFITRNHLSQATGGAEEQCDLFAHEFARRGWDTHYAAEMRVSAPAMVVDGITLHGLPDTAGWWRSNRRRVRSLLRELNPDVVFNLGFDYYTGYAILDAPPKTIRIWATSFDWDGYVMPVVKQRWAMHNPVDYSKWLLFYLPKLLIARAGSRRADLVLVPKREKQEQLRNTGLSIHLFRNALPSLPEANVQTHEGRPMVLWAASLKDWKQPSKFIELAAACRDLDADFVMIGAYHEDKYRDIVAKATRELPNFRYDGAIPLDRVREYYRKSHLLVSTSISEGFGTTLVHAWQHGVPTATLGVNPDQIITDHQMGFVAESMDEFIQGVRRLLTNPEERRAMGKRARAFAEEEHDLVGYVNRLEALLAERGVPLPAR